jgi:hypothetical protein
MQVAKNKGRKANRSLRMVRYPAPVLTLRRKHLNLKNWA